MDVEVQFLCCTKGGGEGDAAISLHFYQSLPLFLTLLYLSRTCVSTKTYFAALLVL